MTIKHLIAMLSKFDENRVVKVSHARVDYDIEESVEEDFVDMSEDQSNPLKLILKT